MRVGLITGEYPPLRGGVGAFADILGRKLAKHHDVFIFSDARAKQQDAHLPLTTYRGGWGYGAVQAIRRWISKNQLDLINIQYQTAAYQMSPWLHFWPQLLPIPIVTTFHDLRVPYLFPKAGALRDWIVMYLARHSVGRIVTNHEDFERVRHLPQTTLIPIGSNIPETILSASDRSSLRQEIGAEEGDCVIGHFGFLNHSKGVDTLLEAAARLDDRRVLLLMIGGRAGTADATNNATGAAIDAQIERLGLQDRIHWTGYVNDDAVSMHLQAADMIALPYRDGASFRRGSLMAAIMHGCAIVTTRPQVTIPEFNAENLLLVAPDDVNALANAIRHLCNDPHLRQHLQEKIHDLRGRFDWDAIATQTTQLFSDVLEDAR